MPISEADAKQCTGFLEVVRSMIDEAEVKIASATRSENEGVLLMEACAQIEVAAKNLAWTAEGIRRIARKRLEEIAHASAANGPVA